METVSPLSRHLKEMSLMFIRALLAGLVTGFACLGYILAPEVAGSKIIGSVMFSFAIIFILLFEMKLFTSMLTDLIHLNLQKGYLLIVGLLANALGCFLCSILIVNTHVGSEVVSASQEIVSTKLLSSNVSTLFSAILCGVCLSLSLNGKFISQVKNFPVIIVITFPVIVFVLAGFDQVVANFFYIFASGSAIDGNTLLFLLMCTVGNAIGVLVLPVCKKGVAALNKGLK